MRGRGLLKDHPALLAAYRSWVPSRGLGAAMANQAGLESLECAILDQGQSSGCTGEGSVQLLACTGLLPWPISGDGLYRDLRCYERPANPDGSLPALQDGGAMPSSLIPVLGTVGVRQMGDLAPDGRFSDMDPSTMVPRYGTTGELVPAINREPRLDEEVTESQRMILGPYAIDMSDPALIAAAIAEGYPVGVPVFVDTTFERWGEDANPSTPLRAENWNGNDPNGGGHWMCCNAYKIDPVYGYVFSGPQSWGSSWGAPPLLVPAQGNVRGHWRVTGSWLQAAAYGKAIVFRVGLQV